MFYLTVTIDAAGCYTDIVDAPELKLVLMALKLIFREDIAV